MSILTKLLGLTAEDTSKLLGVTAEDTAELKAMVAAITKSQAVIEFDLQGNILTANDNFLNAVGYRLDEIVGQHHRIFVAPAEHNSHEYLQFWQKLARGEIDSGQYKRIRKDGKEIWTQASYNAILNADNRPYKVVKFATDITKQVIRNAEHSSQLAAISKSQAVIEFDLHGNILTWPSAMFCRCLRAILRASITSISGKRPIAIELLRPVLVL
jgi:PAS domain S-box-containing protein